MAAHAPKVKRLAWDDQALQLLAPAIEGSPFSLLSTPEEQLHGSDLWEIDYGSVSAVVALRGVQLARGRLVELTGIRSLGERIQPRHLSALHAIARDAYGADLLSMNTRHAHLARTCERAGWCEVGRIVNLPLRVQ